jgi:signal transduction histidine kinase
MSSERTVYRTEFESRAERLGSALHRLAGDLVAERRKVGVLRRELAELSLQRDSPPARSLPSSDAAERMAIERDIHDGIQQRLTALRVRLGMAAEDFSGSGDRRAGAAFATFGDEVEEAIDELRAIARGICPPLLASGGLSAALAATGTCPSSPVSIVAAGTGRYSSEIELAVYFTVLAAIDNAEKHAGPGPVEVALSDTGERLSFSVSDRGPGFDPARVTAGGGITNMRARVAAVRGSLELESHPSRGTRIAGSVPLRPAAV